MSRVCPLCGKKSMVAVVRKKLRGKYNPTGKKRKYPSSFRGLIGEFFTLNKRSANYFRSYLKKNRIIAWKTDKNKIEIELTSFCNLQCTNCNRSMRQAPTNESMDLNQIEHFVKESIDLNWNWKNIRIMGGEPTLHHKLFKVLEIIKKYKEFNPASNIKIVTNGYGKKVNNILSSLPQWLNIENSRKKTPLQWFVTYNVAPTDLKKYRKADFTKACHITEYCGLGLTRYGYYVCGPGASLDRVFGFDIGIKKLSLLKNLGLKNQRKILCKYCGHYKDNKNIGRGRNRTIEERMSPAWLKAYENYKKEKPKLSSLY